MKKIIVLIFISSHFCAAQTESTVLVLTNRNATVLLDGESKGECQANVPYKLLTTAGEHYVQVQVPENGLTLDKGEIHTAEAGKQKVLKLFFEDNVKPVAPGLIKVADLNFSIPGVVGVAAWQNNNPGKKYPYPSHYLAFEKGDVIVINTSMTNKNGTNAIEVSTYPDGVVKYTNGKFSELSNVEIRVEKRSIYRITLATNHAFDRNCLMQISRRPASGETNSFNTNVALKRIYSPVQVIEPQSLRVNSGSNAALMGGKSRLIVPITLPPNTVEWFYRFSASRNAADIENVQKNFALLGDLSKLLLTASGFGVVATKAVDIGIEQLATPPGAHYADIYLLPYEQTGNFQAKAQFTYILQGTRENLMSGNVKVSCCNEGQVYLGVKNPDPYNAVNVSVEVVAITVREEYMMSGDGD